MASGSYKKVIALGLDYSEFQGGIKECTEEMKKLDSEHKALSSEMDKTASSSDKLAEKNEYLAKKIELQSTKVDIAKQKLDELKSSGNATESQIRKATTAFNNETAALNNLQNELVDTNIAQTNLKQNAAALAAVITAIGAACASAVKDVAEYADQLETLSEQTGVSIQTLQGWDYASELIDTDFSAMTDSFKKLEKSMASSPDVFRQLGVEVTDASGHMRKAEDVFYDTIDALREVNNATEQDQMAMAIFGKSATELTGVINAGSAGLKQYQNEAQALGIVLSDDDVEAASQAKDAFDRLSATFEAAKMKIGAELAPVFTVIANAISQIPAPVLASVAAIGALVAVVGLLAVTISSVITAFSNISAAIGASTFVMQPHLLMILAIVAALAILALAIERLIKLYRQWKEEQAALAREGQHLSDSLQLHGGGGHERGGADHKASGGVSKGGMTWVGESGPELVDLPSGARVYNSNESKQISNSPTYNISMNLDITKLKSVKDVVDAVQGLGMSASVGGML